MVSIFAFCIYFGACALFRELSRRRVSGQFSIRLWGQCPMIIVFFAAKNPFPAISAAKNRVGGPFK